MKQKMISFCLPEEYLPDKCWIEAWEKGDLLPLKENGKGATAQSWIYQTWALLKKATFNASLVTQLPQEGIVIVLSGSLNSLLSSSKLVTKSAFIIDVVADGLPHPAAHLHLVQNKAHAARLPRSLFMPHWAQPNLIPRNSERGARFEKVCFFGDVTNLTSELRSKKWERRLQEELGIKFELRGTPHWHDYSDVDCVLAIRDFSKSAQLHKPATKLYNAWLAGVPFIGGRDSAYASDGHPGKDYLVATSPEEVFQHLKCLKEEEAFRTTLVQNGLQSSEAFTREATLERWKKLLQETIPPLASQWQQKSALERRWFFMTQRLCCWIDRYLR